MVGGFEIRVRFVTRSSGGSGRGPELAVALGASRRTLERWRFGESHPQRAARLRLAELLVLARRLEKTFSDGGAEGCARTTATSAG